MVKDGEDNMNTKKLAEWFVANPTIENSASVEIAQAYLNMLEPTIQMVEAFYRAYGKPLSPDRWESPFDNAWEALIKANV